jgi:hypothetical protein
MDPRTNTIPIQPKMSNDALRDAVSAPTMTDARKEQLLRYIHQNRAQAITVMMGLVDRKPEPRRVKPRGIVKAGRGEMSRCNRFCD